ncbi:hypothetical protein FKP32DRAFT_1586243 [Trametes sanguinea]|nr:hypothetical protein FKP32DRAFT_1586243 [Trametes sanguinea]
MATLGAMTFAIGAQQLRGSVTTNGKSDTYTVLPRTLHRSRRSTNPSLAETRRRNDDFGGCDSGHRERRCQDFPLVGVVG